MCGICGEFRSDSRTPSLSAVERMSEQIAPRGPDGAGVFSQANIALGHRRLAVIDLSQASAQPMVDNEHGLAIVFNGEIYNYTSLKSDLEEKGHRFFSTGDTEVVLRSYAEWGKECVGKFYGMFSFAIWERDSGCLVLARYRLGIKPLYYANVPGGLRFASSLTSLL